MIDPVRIHQWAQACQALLDDVSVVVEDDASLNTLAKALVSGDLEDVVDQANQHAAVSRAIDAIEGAKLYFEAAIHRTPPRA